MYKIIGSDGQQYGPAPAEQLRRWMLEGRLAGHSLIQAEGTLDWKPLSAFPEFSGDLKFPPPFTSTPYGSPLPNPIITAKASNKIAAGICGIFLGGFGVHKFVLGYSGAGMIMLLASVLSCGCFYWIMHIIGMIEGIIYLAKPDEEFVRTYVDGQKSWF